MSVSFLSLYKISQIINFKKEKDLFQLTAFLVSVHSQLTHCATYLIVDREQKETGVEVGI